MCLVVCAGRTAAARQRNIPSRYADFKIEPLRWIFGDFARY
jgi:hypothetical protein